MVNVNGDDTEKRLRDAGKIKPLEVMLTENIKSIIGVLPPGFSDAEKKDMVKAMLYLAIKAYDENDALRKCTVDSILKALMDAGSLGMVPFGKMNECAIIPYANKAQFQLEYRGVYRLAMNTGMYKDIRIGIVREEDKFYYEKGFNVDLRHIPSKKPEADRAITHFYGLYILQTGGRDIAVMAKDDMDIHRDKYSKQYRYAKANKKIETALWYTDYPGMGLKTILIKLLKYAPKSEKLIQQLALDKIIKRELAPERKDFTKEAEEEFILERQADAEGSEIFDEKTGDEKKENKGKGTDGQGKGKKKLVTEEALNQIFAMGKMLQIDEKDLNNKIKIRFKLNNVNEMTEVQANKLFKDLKVEIDKSNKEAETIDKKIAEEEKKEQEKKEGKKEPVEPEKEEKIEQPKLT